jgi:hypothetical protein
MSDDATRHVQGSTGDASGGGPDDEQRVVIVTPGGMGVAGPPESGSQNHDDREKGGEGHEGHDETERTNPADLVEEPAKVMRIGSMVKQLLDEVRSAPLDEAGRRRLADIHHRSIDELKDGLAPELGDELDRLAQPFSDAQPSAAELRIAQAQLVGWLEGLFHGIQTALVAQQMAAQHQLQQMRALPPGPGGVSYGTPPGLRPGDDSRSASGDTGPTGQYL